MFTKMILISALSQLFNKVCLKPKASWSMETELSFQSLDGSYLEGPCYIFRGYRQTAPFQRRNEEKKVKKKVDRRN